VKQASLLVGVEEGTWHHWERGEWKPTARTIPRIDGFLGLSCRTVFPSGVRCVRSGDLSVHVPERELSKPEDRYATGQGRPELSSR
jgi:hypothetical protein